jgi:hypothetical protein
MIGILSPSITLPPIEGLIRPPMQIRLPLPGPGPVPELNKNSSVLSLSEGDGRFITFPKLNAYDPNAPRPTNFKLPHLKDLNLLDIKAPRKHERKPKKKVYAPP